MGKRLQGWNGLCGEHFFPPAKGAEEEIVESTHQTGNEQRLSLVATFLSANEHLCGGSGFREGEFAVHFFHEIFAERNEEQNAQQATQQRTKEHFQEVDRDFRIFHLQNVEGGKGENCTRHHNARRCANGLNQHIFAKRIFAFGDSCNAGSNDGNRDCSLKHLTHFQTQVGCGSAENHCHHQTHTHRIAGGFGVRFVGTHRGNVFFPGLQFCERIFGQSHFALHLSIHHLS